MEVRFCHRVRVSGLVFVFCFLLLSLGIVSAALGATYRTKNFVVSAHTSEYAKKVGDAAEMFRQQLAIFWLGAPIRSWAKPCPITVRAGANLGAGGETSFTFADDEVYGWRMKIQGSHERILDSVLPHEISHTILATYFREPVPRWIDEGAATFVEADVERNNYRNMLIGFLKSGKGIPFNDLVSFKEYPAEQMPFYSQGFSVCEYMILVGGPRRFIEFAKSGMKGHDWSVAVHKFYGYENLGDLQVRWQNWVSDWYLAGMPTQLPQVAQIGDIRANGPAASDRNIYLAQATVPVDASLIGSRFAGIRTNLSGVGTGSEPTIAAATPVVRANTAVPTGMTENSVSGQSLATAVGQTNVSPAVSSPSPVATAIAGTFPMAIAGNASRNAAPAPPLTSGVGSVQPANVNVTEPNPLKVEESGDQPQTALQVQNIQNAGNFSRNQNGSNLASENTSFSYQGSYGRPINQPLSVEKNSSEVKLLGQSPSQSPLF